jgi:hypothetical protein
MVEFNQPVANALLEASLVREALKNSYDEFAQAYNAVQNVPEKPALPFMDSDGKITEDEALITSTLGQITGDSWLDLAGENPTSQERVFAEFADQHDLKSIDSFYESSKSPEQAAGRAAGYALQADNALDALDAGSNTGSIDPIKAAEAAIRSLETQTSILVTR